MFKNAKEYDNCEIKTSWNKGIDQLDPETRLRISKAGGAAMKARGHTDEMREHLSKVHTGRTITEEWRKKISEAALKRPPRGAVYAGKRIVDWAKFFGVDQSTVREQINNGTFERYYKKKTGNEFKEESN